MECPLCGHHKNHKHGKTKEVNAITVPFASKLSLKHSIPFTTADKLNDKRFERCYNLILKAAASEELVEPQI